MQMFYSYEQYREYQDELMYGNEYNEELAALAYNEIRYEGEYDEHGEPYGPQERTATWTQEGHTIHVHYPNGCWIDLPRYNPCHPFPKLGHVEIDDEVPF